MTDTKAELIRQILATQDSEREIVRLTKAMRPTITMMVQVAGGKLADVEYLSRRLAERMLPAIRETAREKYGELFTEKQLATLAAFHADNPWYHDLNHQLSEAMNAAATSKCSPIMKEVFEEYLPNEAK